VRAAGAEADVQCLAAVGLRTLACSLAAAVTAPAACARGAAAA
jgi:hypothetical protein